MVSDMDKTTIINLHNKGLSKRKIANTPSIAPNTVKRYIREYEEAKARIEAAEGPVGKARIQKSALEAPRMATSGRKPRVFGEVAFDNLKPVVANTIIDRPIHHSAIIRITGRSCRIKGLMDEEGADPLGGDEGGTKKRRGRPRKGAIGKEGEMRLTEFLRRRSGMVSDLQIRLTKTCIIRLAFARKANRSCSSRCPTSRSTGSATSASARRRRNCCSASCRAGPRGSRRWRRPTWPSRSGRRRSGTQRSPRRWSTGWPTKPR